MAGKCLLFVYGTLKPDHQPPRSMSQSWEDEISGDLYDLGEYPAAIRIGDSSNRITGFTIEIDHDELAAIDEFEDIETGVYRRIMVETKNGLFAWVYEYLQPIPPGSTLLTVWRR